MSYIYIQFLAFIMNNDLNSFDIFVDDLLDSDENLLKGELDLLLMQNIFNSLELESLKQFQELEGSYFAA